MFAIEDLGGTFEQVCQVHKKNNFDMPVAIKGYCRDTEFFLVGIDDNGRDRFCFNTSDIEERAMKFHNLREAYSKAEQLRDKHVNSRFEIVSIAGIS